MKKEKDSNRKPVIAKKGNRSIYQALWRWHFYAGLIFAPFILMLATTGSIYLFKPQIEQWMYQDYYEVTKQEQKLEPAAQVETVKTNYPDAQVVRYRPGEGATRSAEVKITKNGESLTIFVDPYTGDIMGELNDKNRFIDQVEAFHGELMLGTFGDRVVELTACWAFILVVTGLAIWFPKGKRKALGTLLPRLNRGRRILIRDLHAVPGFWLSLAIIFLVLTGLLWSGLWGTKVQSLTTNAGLGYPPSVWIGSAPNSTVQTKEIADVPWAAETLEVPVSTSLQGFIPVSINDVVAIANEQNIYPTYEVIYPSDPEGVYTISVFPPKARDEATLHIDQYTGAILADYRYDNYQPLGKLMAWGITVHKGLEYGFLNQLAGLIVCIGIAGIVISGVILWWRRKPEGHLGAPPSPGVMKSKRILAVIILFSVLFPLIGLSIIAVLLIDRFVIQQSNRLSHLFKHKRS